MASQERDSFFIVGLPKHRGPAVHVCRYPAPAPRQPSAFMVLPYPKPDPWRIGALAAEELLLPEGLTGRRLPLLPSSVAGLCALWDEHPQSPFLVPLSVVHERRVDREWRAGVLVTPSSVGVPADSGTLANVAWAVLCRVDRTVLMAVLAQLSCLSDRFRWDAEHSERVVRAMQPLPPLVRGRLLAAAKGGQALLHPRCVQWVLREMAVVPEDERQRRARWLPAGLDDASLNGRGWFRCLRGGSPPGLDEVLLAVWMLHEAFVGAEPDGEGPGWLMSMTTALSYRFDAPGSWMHTLDRWMAIWSVDDNHPAVASSALTPSQVRTLYESKLGVDIVSWLAGVWAICMRWWLQLDGGRPVVIYPEDLFSPPLDSALLMLSRPFRTAFRSHAIGTIDEFRNEAMKEAGGRYAGLGTLPQGDSLACRNYPVLEMPDGTLIPVSIELVADRATVLHKLRLDRRSAAISACGKMFEAYVTDQIDRLRKRHLVASETEITSILGHLSRCDAVIVDGTDVLAIEATVQTLPRDVARGGLRAINDMANRYQAKADQAVATIRALSTLSAGLRIPTPTSATYLVVTETAVPHSPVFQRTLAALRPDRTSKFVCDIGDLEMLVDLGLAGWSVPRAVASWQAKPDEIPFEVHLDDMSRTLPPTRSSRYSPADWLSRLPSHVESVA